MTKALRIIFGGWFYLAHQLADDFKEADVQYQVVALNVRGSRVYGYGVSQERAAKGFAYFENSLHAEADLIRRFGLTFKGNRIFVYRFNTFQNSPLKNHPKCAKPCLLCGHLLRGTNVKSVVYFNAEGNVEETKRMDLSELTDHPVALTARFIQARRSNVDKHFDSNRFIV